MFSFQSMKRESKLVTEEYFGDAFLLILKLQGRRNTFP